MKKQNLHRIKASKKGVTFTLISIILVTLLFMSLTAYTNTNTIDKSFIINERIKSIDYFIEDLENDINRGVYIAGFRTLLGIQQYITSSGNHINNTNDVFKELIINGTINGSYMSVMENTELKVWFDKMSNEASDISINIEYKLLDVNVYHEKPFEITIDLNVSLNISDKFGTAYWIRNKTIPTKLEIDYFEDPMYTVNTYGRVINTIVRSNITNFVTGIDTTNLKYHIDNGLYITTNSSPSYLMRLEGNYSNSTHGIESIVNLRNLDDASLTILDKTCVDYLYFSSNDPTNYHVNYTYNWLNLDNEANHYGIYDVTDIIDD